MAKAYPKLLSLIVPVYHQEKTIERNLREISATLALLPINYEVIVVIDGIDDASYQNAIKCKLPHVSVVGYKTNHGKGYAVRFGMAKSHGDVIGFLDAGGDLAVDGLPMMIEHFRWYNADIIVGSKRHPASKIKYPFSRRVMSAIYQMLSHMMFGLNVRDTQVGMKLYRRDVLEDVLPRLLVKKFAFDIEILAVSWHLGYKRIFEAPVELDFNGISSITSRNYWKVIYWTLWDTLAVFYRLNLLHYYDDLNKRQWKFDPELNFRVNIG
jgi:glycosyltransferase involved in cell wall biosynthesis